MSRRLKPSAGRRLGAAAVSVLILTTQSCSRPPAQDDQTVAPSYYSSPRAVCGLLQDDHLRATVGYEFNDGIDTFTLALQGIVAITKCVYPPGGRARKFVTTGVVYAYAPQIFEEVKQTREVLVAEQVTGVGSRALWYPQARELLVLAKGKLLGVQLGSDVLEANSHVKERARRLAQIMIRRLK